MVAKSTTKISAFQGVVILIDAVKINNLNIANSWNMTISVLFYSYQGYYNLTFNNSIFGPNFNSKCIFGNYGAKFKGSDTNDFYFTYNSKNHYDIFRMDSTSTPGY